MSKAATRRRGPKQRTQRYTSNVFSMFTEQSVQEFKEAFNMIDTNKDGVIDSEDLSEMLVSLGRDEAGLQPYVERMLAEAPGPINFTMFLTLFGEKMSGSDPEETIRNAFACFDPEGTGVISEEQLREMLTTMGDRWTDEQVDELLHGAPVRDGRFDYAEFARTIKHGKKEEGYN
uniref:Myosin regulatory light chain ef-hand protein n=3 Tax=Macrostomum lignano TaxID=282301 RepID=A0A1I8HI47_9PLAT